VLDRLKVDKPSRLLVQRAVDGHDVGLRQHLLEGLDPSAVECLGGVLRERRVVEVEQFLAVEGNESLKNLGMRQEQARSARVAAPKQIKEHVRTSVPDSASPDCRNDLPLEIESGSSDLGDVPVPSLDHLVRGRVVSDEEQDGHDDVLGDRDNVRPADLRDGDASLVGSVEVDVVGSDYD
jgi:hypothetical protein